MGRRTQLMLDEAYAATGRRYARLIVAAHWVLRALPWAAAALVLGGLGWLARWAWLRLTAPDAVSLPVAAPAVHADPVGAVPLWLWLCGGMLLAVLLWLSRPGQVVTPSLRRARLLPACGLLLVAAGMVGVGLSALSGG